MISSFDLKAQWSNFLNFFYKGKKLNIYYKTRHVFKFLNSSQKRPELKKKSLITGFLKGVPGFPNGTPSFPNRVPDGHRRMRYWGWWRGRIKATDLFYKIYSTSTKHLYSTKTILLDGQSSSLSLARRQRCRTDNSSIRQGTPRVWDSIIIFKGTPIEKETVFFRLPLEYKQ